MNSNSVEDIAAELSTILVSALNLDIPPSEIDINTPLFEADGLGLDSIDSLEIALVVSKRYGFTLSTENTENKRVFFSLKTLATHVFDNRTI